MCPCVGLTSKMTFLSNLPELVHPSFISTYAVLLNYNLQCNHTPNAPMHIFTINNMETFQFQIKSNSNQILFVQHRDQAAVVINAMLNRNDKAMKALTVTLM